MMKLKKNYMKPYPCSWLEIPSFANMSALPYYSYIFK